MADFPFAQAVPGTRTTDMSVDAGLRGFMLGVFNKMAVGLAVSAALAYLVGTVPVLTHLVFGTPLLLVFQFGPLVLLLVSGFTMKNPSPLASGIIYWSIVSMIGVTLGIWVAAASAGQLAGGMMTIVKAFLTTSAAFGGLALWGYTTKRDLSGFGVFLMMGLIGIIIASLINMFFRSDMLSFIISVGGVLIFAGLTAFDTQRLKHTYYALGGDQRSMAVATNYGALSLYLDFVNLFQFIMSIMSSRR